MYGRSDVRSSLTYPPTYIRYHQMQLDIPTYSKIWRHMWMFPNTNFSQNQVGELIFWILALSSNPLGKSQLWLVLQQTFTVFSFEFERRSQHKKVAHYVTDIFFEHKLYKEFQKIVVKFYIRHRKAPVWMPNPKLTF